MVLVLRAAAASTTATTSGERRGVVVPVVEMIPPSSAERRRRPSNKPLLSLSNHAGGDGVGAAAAAAARRASLQKALQKVAKNSLPHQAPTVGGSTRPTTTLRSVQNLIGQSARRLLSEAYKKKKRPRGGCRCVSFDLTKTQYHETSTTAAPDDCTTTTAEGPLTKEAQQKLEYQWRQYKRELWYQPAELARFKATCQDMCRHMSCLLSFGATATGEDDMMVILPGHLRESSSFPLRGLELLVCPQRQRKKLANQAQILLAAASAASANKNDEESLAKLARELNVWATKIAMEEAKLDYEAVYGETRTTWR